MTADAFAGLDTLLKVAFGAVIAVPILVVVIVCLLIF